MDLKVVIDSTNNNDNDLKNNKLNVDIILQKGYYFTILWKYWSEKCDNEKIPQNELDDTFEKIYNMNLGERKSECEKLGLYLFKE